MSFPTTFCWCTIILLFSGYDDVEESSRYKHLDARWEKKKEASNPNTRKEVKANTVVFTSLALL
jgi:hypothetical protein